MPGTVPAQAAQGRGRNLIYRGLAVTLLACENHVGLEQHFFERDALLKESVEHGVEHRSGDLLAPLDRVRAVHEHFRLDDRYQVLLLTEGSVPRQRKRIGAHAGGTRQGVRDANDRPPLREACTHAAIFPQTIP